MSANRIKRLNVEELEQILTNTDVVLAVKANISVMRCVEAEIAALERVVKERVKLRPAF